MKSITVQALNFIASLIILSPANSLAGNPSLSFSKPTITCGSANKYKETLIITNESENIPYITQQANPNFYFGCKVDYPDNIFTLHAQITSPQADNVSANIGYTKNITDKTFTVTTRPVTFKNIGFIALRLNEGDLPGKYKIKVFVNNKPVAYKSFDVSKLYNRPSGAYIP